jgi:hypothetical protein
VAVAVNALPHLHFGLVNVDSAQALSAAIEYYIAAAPAMAAEYASRRAVAEQVAAAECASRRAVAQATRAAEQVAAAACASRRAVAQAAYDQAVRDRAADVA